MSMVPLLKGSHAPISHQFWLYSHYSSQGGGTSSALRFGDWKLIEFYGHNNPELYNLPGILKNAEIYLTLPERTAEMLEILNRWKAETHAKVPLINTYYNPDFPRLEKKWTWKPLKNMSEYDTLFPK